MDLIESPRVCFPLALVQENLLFTCALMAPELCEVYQLRREEYVAMKTEFVHSEHLDALESFEESMLEIHIANSEDGVQQDVLPAEDLESVRKKANTASHEAE